MLLPYVTMTATMPLLSPPFVAPPRAALNGTAMLLSYVAMTATMPLLSPPFFAPPRAALNSLSTATESCSFINLSIAWSMVAPIAPSTAMN